jgi:single-strand DNA-binding protein
MTEASVSFAGNLTDNPELRHTEGGVARAMLRVAVSGRREQEASFFTVVVWRDQAEHAVESLSKGSRVVVVGRLRQRTWTAEDGSARSVVEVVTEELGRACAGRPPRRPRRPDRAEPGSRPGQQTPSSLRQEPVIDITSRMCPRSPTNRWRSCDDPAIEPSLAIRLERHLGRQEVLRWISASRASSSLCPPP